MASGTEIFAGLLFLAGLILAIIGIIVLVVNTKRQFWMWALLIGGVILLIIGAFVWYYGRSSSQKKVTTEPEGEMTDSETEEEGMEE